MNQSIQSFKLDPARLAELLAKARASRITSSPTQEPNQVQTAEGGLRIQQVSQIQETNSSIQSNLSAPQHTGMHGELVTYNSKQQAIIDLVLSGKDCILLGAAGTGKTTSIQGAIQALIQSGAAGILDGEDHKHLPLEGAPGIVITSFTRRAVSNVRKVVNTGMKANCITHHKLLEYQPEYYTVWDEETGAEKNTMRFAPTRNQVRTLPPSLRVIFIEESSMYSNEFYTELILAKPSHTQFIFIGDINQLPPVFGSAVLGYKLLELPTIELTEVYRQALESPIIRLAHRILSGTPILKEEYPEWYVEGKLKLHPWKKKLSSDLALATAAKFFTTALDSGAFNPTEDMILLPFNKAFGTIELNKHIANHLARTQSKITHEIIAGFNKHYLSVGDKVLYEKEDAYVVSITPNPSYSGAAYQPASSTLDYWGHDSSLKVPEVETSEEDIDFYLTQIALDAGSDAEDRVRQASHQVVVRIDETDTEVTLEAAADLNSLLLSYALTVHKSQGSEWRKVFLVLHQSHATMIQRELLYTAVTRAREELYVICEPETFTNGIISQRIKGNTLEEKCEYFKGKLERTIS